MRKFILLSLPILLLPAIVLAQASNINAFVQQIITIINTTLVPLVFAVAFIVFIWGMVQYFILGAADEDKRSAGKSLMIWGLIAFFVMASVWGIVNLLIGSFGLNQVGAPTFPTTPTR